MIVKLLEFVKRIGDIPSVLMYREDYLHAAARMSRAEIAFYLKEFPRKKGSKGAWRDGMESYFFDTMPKKMDVELEQRGHRNANHSSDRARART